MAKETTASNTGGNETEELQKPILIKDASINDSLCNCGYEIMHGVGTGDNIKRKGSAVVHEDLTAAFQALNVHLAAIDDAFLHDKKVKTIDDAIAHADTDNYSVSGFKVSGDDPHEKVVLTGTKWAKSGILSIETPKIELSGSYRFVGELKEAIDRCREEVEAYMNGKKAPVLEQTVMDFGGGTDEDFSQAAL